MEDGLWVSHINLINAWEVATLYIFCDAKILIILQRKTKFRKFKINGILISMISFKFNKIKIQKMSYL